MTLYKTDPLLLLCTADFSDENTFLMLSILVSPVEPARHFNV